MATTNSNNCNLASGQLVKNYLTQIIILIGVAKNFVPISICPADYVNQIEIHVTFTPPPACSSAWITRLGEYSFLNLWNEISSAFVTTLMTMPLKTLFHYSRGLLLKGNYAAFSETPILADIYFYLVRWEANSPTLLFTCNTFHCKWLTIQFQIFTDT